MRFRAFERDGEAYVFDEEFRRLFRLEPDVEHWDMPPLFAIVDTTPYLPLEGIVNTKEIILICAKLALNTLAVPSPDTTNDFGTGAKAQQQAIVRRLTEIANDASKIKRFFGA